MGSLQAVEMAEALELEEALAWHLRANHYPPIPLEMVGVCVEAIQAVNEYDENREVELPAGVTYKGSATAPAHAIVTGHHLEPWIDRED